MPREPRDVTEGELAILRLLWRQSGMSIRQLTDDLHGQAADAAQYATVKKQLERMEAKGLVSRDRSLFVHRFSPAVAREELVGRRLSDLADTLCEGSFAPILGFLGKARALSAEERAALRELIDQHEPAPRQGKRRKK